MKKRKNSNTDILNILHVICQNKNISNDIEKQIYGYSLNFLNLKQKNDITKYFPLLREIQIKKKYEIDFKYLTSKLFFKLPHKYKKGFLLYLKYDIFSYTIQHIYAIQFAINHLNDIVTYIGNRNELIHRDVFEFICFYYGEFGFCPPTQVKIRTILTILTDYFYMNDEIEMI